MLNYIPERIHEKIKDDERFISLDETIHKHFNECKTLTDVVLFDESLKKFKINDYIKYTENMYAMVSDHCPTYIAQTRICLDTRITKDMLLTMWDRRELEEYDKETQLFIVSYLINNSFEDKTYNTYQKWYINLYETIDPLEYTNFSTYVHLKYMVAKVEDYAINDAPKDGAYLDSVFNLLNALYTKYTTYIRHELLKYIYIEIFDHTLTNAFLFVDNDKLIFDKIKDIKLPDGILDNKYHGTSINELGILDKQFELGFAIRDFEYVSKKYDEIIDWINISFKDPVKLFNTLRIYDKVMAPNFAALIRRYVKLAKLFLNNEDDPYIEITKVDREFVQLDDFDSFEFSNQATRQSFIRLSSHIDQWFENNKITIGIFANYYHTIYKESKENV